MVRRTIILILALGVCLWGFPAWALNDWIMETDNHDATLTGTWSTSTARILYYGDDYRATPCSGDTGTATATATFVARNSVDVTGLYSVYARWTIDPNRSTAAPYQIFLDDGDAAPTTTVNMNQEGHGGEWRYLGVYNFTATDQPKVVLRNNCVAEADGAYVIADAVRWVKENIDAGDTVDEPGIDWMKSTTSTTIASTTEASPTLVASQSVTCPASGYTSASYTSELSYAGTGNNTYANVLYSISRNSTAWDNNCVQQIGDWVVNNTYWKRAAPAIQRADSCSAGATVTYRVYAYRGATTLNTSYVWQPTLVINYFTTGY